MRPDEDVDGAIVNEDSQSLVFDATTLFERDKFSGDDRIEGGTRANLGLRYAGQLRAGLTIDALVGQSYHLAGENPYAEPSQRLDLVNAGAQSGLETDRSDIVAALSIATALGFEAAGRVRLDEDDLDIERAEAEASYAGFDFSALAKYAYVDGQPDAAGLAARHQLHGAGRVRGERALVVCCQRDLRHRGRSAVAPWRGRHLRRRMFRVRARLLGEPPQSRCNRAVVAVQRVLEDRRRFRGEPFPGREQLTSVTDPIG